MYDDVNLQLFWDEQNKNLSLLEYIPVNRGGGISPATKLLLDFKENRLLALEKVEALAIEAWSLAEEDFLEYNCRYLVALPSSSAEHPNAPCETICAALAERFPYLTYLPGALRRIETVPSSARAQPGMRLDRNDHLRTIRYVGPTLSLPDSSIIMVDDIVTRKATSSACRDILKQVTYCKSVLGFFIGRTVY